MGSKLSHANPKVVSLFPKLNRRIIREHHLCPKRLPNNSLSLSFIIYFFLKPQTKSKRRIIKEHHQPPKKLPNSLSLSLIIIFLSQTTNKIKDQGFDLTISNFNHLYVASRKSSGTPIRGALEHNRHSSENLNSAFPESRLRPEMKEIPVKRIKEEMSILDLPELALECILERLPPKVLLQMRGVCSSLRERCVSDHLWEKHIKMKWGRIIGPAASREWQWQSMVKHNHNQKQPNKAPSEGDLMRILSSVSLSWRNNFDDSTKHWRSTCFSSHHHHDNSVMSWYLALETGRFWFPAQVYSRENGHVGFVLSCYDAVLSYDPRTNTFQARYPPFGRRAVVVEDCVPWERLRAPPIDTPPHDLHISDCLNDLYPGDHIEIQWRINKEFPYGWWYGVVGHLESFDGNENYCLCHNSDNVVVEFNQYARGSQWRCTVISRKNHQEGGNEVDGFYGGVRKLHTKEEISVWKRLWPAQVLE